MANAYDGEAELIKKLSTGEPFAIDEVAFKITRINPDQYCVRVE